MKKNLLALTILLGFSTSASANLAWLNFKAGSSSITAEEQPAQVNGASFGMDFTYMVPMVSDQMLVGGFLGLGSSIKGYTKDLSVAALGSTQFSGGGSIGWSPNQNFMIYGKAGLAKTSTSIVITNPLLPKDINDDLSSMGVTYGIGTFVGGENVTFGVEYQVNMGEQKGKKFKLKGPETNIMVTAGYRF
ncbi:outer membrane protein [Vibrio nigripulchritudo]|uniref:outer membrane protein n=1 Tax=Vibrio nigripulchritudo TaxID=28173 RepID=UPI0003B1C0D8|nr:outer membrane beta-barrel protein [Vibrio nigripulchritudo]CCN71260.1 exported hypothetical protein [Vibrio nigripulchritudo SFn118]